MHIKCGESGSKANLCYISDGTLQLDGTAIRGITDETVDNVVIEGFVFTEAIGHSLLVTKPGDITFIDCEWRVSAIAQSNCGVSVLAHVMTFFCFHRILSDRKFPS